MSDSPSAPASPVAAAVPAAAAANSAVPPGTPAPAASTAAAAGDTPIAASVLTDPPAVAPGEAKPAQEGAEAVKPDAGKEGDPAAGEVKPVEYTDFTLPEGLAAENPTLAEFRAEASKLGLSQEQAQALVTKVGGQIAEAAQAQLQTWVKMNNDWQSAIKADKEIGGANFEPMRISVAKLFDDYVGPVNSPERKALNEALLLTGAGNNPAIVKAWARIAAAHGEGSHVAGNPPRTAASDSALFFPKSIKS